MNVPADPPYEAIVSNFPLQTTESQIYDFFKDLEINNVGPCSDGKSILSFKDKNNLLKALQMNGLSFNGTALKIELLKMNKLPEFNNSNTFLETHMAQFMQMKLAAAFQDTSKLNLGSTSMEDMLKAAMNNAIQAMMSELKPQTSNGNVLQSNLSEKKMAENASLHNSNNLESSNNKEVNPESKTLQENNNSNGIEIPLNKIDTLNELNPNVTFENKTLKVNEEITIDENNTQECDSFQNHNQFPNEKAEPICENVASNKIDTLEEIHQNASTNGLETEEIMVPDKVNEQQIDSFQNNIQLSNEAKTKVDSKCENIPLNVEGIIEEQISQDDLNDSKNVLNEINTLDHSDQKDTTENETLINQKNGNEIDRDMQQSTNQSDIDNAWLSDFLPAMQIYSENLEQNKSFQEIDRSSSEISTRSDVSTTKLNIEAPESIQSNMVNKVSQIDSKDIPKYPPFKLEITNLPQNTNENAIRNFLSNCKILAISFEQQNENQKECLVSFKQRLDLIEAIKLNNTMLKENLIKMVIWKKNKIKNEEIDRNLSDNSSQISTRSDVSTTKLNIEAPESIQSNMLNKVSQIDSKDIPKYPPFKLEITNLPQNTNENDIRNFLSNCKILAISFEQQNENQKECLVSFKQRLDLIEAIKLNNTMLKENLIKMAIWKKNKTVDKENAIVSVTEPTKPHENKQENLNGIPSLLLLKVKEPENVPVPKLFLSNVPPNFNHLDIRKLLPTFNILSIDKPNNKPIAFVQLSTIEDVNRALQMGTIKANDKKIGIVQSTWKRKDTLADRTKSSSMENILTENDRRKNIPNNRDDNVKKVTANVTQSENLQDQFIKTDENQPKISYADIPNYPPFKAELKNLPSEITGNEINNLFPQLKIFNISFPNRNENLHGNSCVLEFRRRADLIEALNMSPIKFQNQQMNVVYLGKITKPNNVIFKVFISNLPPTFGPLEIRNQVLPGINIALIDRPPRTSFAFVTFPNQQELDKALNIGNVQMNGFNITIKPASGIGLNEKSSSPSTNENKKTPLSEIPPTNQINSPRKENLSESSRDSQMENTSIPQYPPFRAFVSDIPLRASKDEIRNLFPSIKIQSISMGNKLNEVNKLQAYCVINFNEKEDLFNALQLKEIQLYNLKRKIELFNHQLEGNYANNLNCSNPTNEPKMEIANNLMENKTVPIEPPFKAIVYELTSQITPENIRKFFALYRIENINYNLMQNYCVVEFKERQDLISFLNCPEPHIFEKRVKIDIFNEKKIEEISKINNNHESSQIEIGTNSNQISDQQAKKESGQNDISNNRPIQSNKNVNIPMYPPFRAILSNLPADATQSNIQHFMAKFNHLPFQYNPLNQYCIVQLKMKQDLKKLLDISGPKINGSKISIDVYANEKLQSLDNSKTKAVTSETCDNLESGTQLNIIHETNTNNVNQQRSSRNKNAPQVENQKKNNIRSRSTLDLSQTGLQNDQKNRFGSTQSLAIDNKRSRKSQQNVPKPKQSHGRSSSTQNQSNKGDQQKPNNRRPHGYRVRLKHMPIYRSDREITNLCNGFGNLVNSINIVRERDKESVVVVFKTLAEADFTLKGINRQNLGIEAEYAPAEPRKPSYNNQPLLGVPKTAKDEKTFDSRETGPCILCTMTSKHRCSRCGAFYCSEKCQQVDWRRHSLKCLPPSLT